MTVRVYLKQPGLHDRLPKTFIVNASSAITVFDAMQNENIPSIGDLYDDDKLRDWVCDSINVTTKGVGNFEVLCLYKYRPWE